MDHDLEMIYSEIDCENSRHKMELQKLEYLKLKEEAEHRKNLGELIEKKYALIYKTLKCKTCVYRPERMNFNPIDKSHTF